MESVTDIWRECVIGSWRESVIDIWRECVIDIKVNYHFNVNIRESL